MPETPLVLPHDLEGLLVDLIKDVHGEHLAKAERSRGLDPRTLEGFKTVVRMTDAQALKLTGDTVPAVLLGIIGAPTFERNEEDGIDAVFQLGVQVTVEGNRRRDTLLRRDIMAWTLIECLYQRTPRRGPIQSVRLVDYEPLADSDRQRTVGDARMVWEVGVSNVLQIGRGIPATDREWPAEAGGRPDQPYDPLSEYPEATTSMTFERKATIT